MCKISIIIPVYNSKDTLSRCLDSVCAQTLEDIEIICINDGSSDGSLEILKQYANKDKRIVLIDHKNQGAGLSRNLGIKNANGQYIGFVDSDDWVEADYFENLYNKIKETNAKIARSAYHFFYPQNSSVVKQNDISKIIETKVKNNELLGPNDHTVVVWCALYKTSFIKENKIRFGLQKLYEDLLFTSMATILSDKTVPVLDFGYYHLSGVDNQISKLGKKTVEPLILSTFEVINFLNSVKIDENVYADASKRCLFRLDEILKLEFIYNYHDEIEKKEYFDAFCKIYSLIKTKIENEPYIEYLDKKDYSGYKNYALLKPKKILPKIFSSINHRIKYKKFKAITIFGMTFRFEKDK